MPPVKGLPVRLESDQRTLKREVRRKGFHMAAGIGATPLVLYVGLEYVTVLALAMLVFVTVEELLYWKLGFIVPIVTKEYAAIRRSKERFSWASTLFLVAIVAILWLVPMPLAFATLALLALGDGVSALYGRAFGRHKLFYNRRKSWEGTVAGLIAGGLGGLAMSWWYYAATRPGVVDAYPGHALIPLIVAGAITAAIVESLPTREDNLSVPLASGLAMTGLWVFTGLEPAAGEIFLRLLGS